MVALLVFFVIESEPVRFVRDYAFFKGGDGLTYTEIYYKISYKELTYTEDELMSSTLRFSFYCENLSTGDSLVDEWEKKSVISSLEEAKNRDLEIVELSALLLKPGDYEFRYRVVDLSSANEGTILDTVAVPSFEGDELLSSSVELASNIEQDSLPGQFFKNNLKVIPNPGGYYSVTRPILYTYTEVYNLSSDTLPFQVEYIILDEQGALLKEYPAKHLIKTGSNIVDVGVLNVIGLPIGSYHFRIVVTDSGTGASISREKSFSVIPFRKGPPPELEEYYRMVEYLMPSEELEFHNSLSEKAKVEYLYQFWSRLDPDPKTEENEALIQFAEKIRFADERFTVLQEKGRDTDRGRIYIKYDDPDEIRRSGIEHLFRPWESWLYYGAGGRQFIFVDLRGSGAYELMYSSIPEEPTRPGWQSYVDPSIVEFRQ